MLKKLPRLDDEVEKFEMDLKEIINHQPSMPEKKNGIIFDRSIFMLDSILRIL